MSEDHVKRQLTEIDDLDARIARMLAGARNDFRHFCEYVIKDEETNDAIALAEIHRQWIDHIDYCWSRGLFAGILAPWGHGKTSIMEAIPLFLFGHDPSLRIKIASCNDELAMERVGKIREMIETSEEYKELFGDHVQPHPTKPWTEHKIYLSRSTTARDASLEAKGIMSKAIGGRADVLIFDDINDETNTIGSPKDRAKVWKKYLTTFMSRLEPRGRMVFIGTRWHEEDVFGCIMSDAAMRRRYGWLVQRIYPECEDIESSFYYPENPRLPVKGKLDKRFNEDPEFKMAA